MEDARCHKIIIKHIIFNLNKYIAIAEIPQVDIGMGIERETEKGAASSFLDWFF